MQFNTLTAFADQVSLSCIEGGRHDIAPQQRMACPASRLYGQGTCLMVIQQIIQQKGTLAGLPEIYAQLSLCQHAARHINQLTQHKHRPDGKATALCCVFPMF